MEQPDFPPNSKASKRDLPEKNIERITTSDPIRKKRSIGRNVKEVFIEGTIKNAMRYVILDILIPEAKDMLVEAVSEGFSRLVHGESRRSRTYSHPQSGPTGYVSYNRYSGPMGGASRMPSGQRAMSRQARARHDFDEIVLDSRTEAEQVIDQMFEVVNRYGSATVADLYELVGLSSVHTDHKWGWTELSGAGVTRLRDGYLLDLPDPNPLD